MEENILQKYYRLHDEIRECYNTITKAAYNYLRRNFETYVYLEYWSMDEFDRNTEKIWLTIQITNGTSPCKKTIEVKIEELMNFYAV